MQGLGRVGTDHASDVHHSARARAGRSPHPAPHPNQHRSEPGGLDWPDMALTDEVRSNLRLLVDLVNSGRPGYEEIPDAAALRGILHRYAFSITASGTARELQQVHAVRDELAPIFAADSVEPVVELVNTILRRTNALPQLVRHDGWDWHLHAVPGTAPVADWIAVDIALALVDMIRQGELERLRRCAAPDCDGVFVDFSRNRSKRFCDLGNCANRTHVAAYRQRRT